MNQDDEHQEGNQMQYTSSNLLNVSLYDAVCLASLIELGANEELTYIKAIRTFEEPLTPSGTYDFEVVKNLVDKKILIPQSGSSEDDFAGEAESAEEDLRDDLEDLCLRWPADHKGGTSLSQASAELEYRFRTKNWPEAWKEQVVPVWKTIILQEALDYLHGFMEEQHFDFDQYEAAGPVLQKTLETFSLGHTFNIIWTSVKSAANAREWKADRRQGAKTVLDKIKKRTKEVIADRRNMRIFERPPRYPQSRTSKVFFIRVLQIGEGYFRQTVPCDDVNNPMAETSENDCSTG